MRLVGDICIIEVSKYLRLPEDIHNNLRLSLSNRSPNFASKLNYTIYGGITIKSDAWIDNYLIWYDKKWRLEVFFIDDVTRSISFIKYCFYRSFRSFTIINIITIITNSSEIRKMFSAKSISLSECEI